MKLYKLIFTLCCLPSIFTFVIAIVKLHNGIYRYEKISSEQYIIPFYALSLIMA